MSQMMLVRPNLHRLDVAARQMLFHVPSSSLFELDRLSRDLLDLFEGHEQVTSEMLKSGLADRYPDSEVAEALDELQALEVVVSSDVKPRLNAKPKAITDLPLTTLVLNVNTGCNLSCTYCYKEDLAVPAAGTKMSYETAIQAVEMLLHESPGQPHYNIVFFGGEPLTRIELIRNVVRYCEQRFAQHGAGVDFTLTTNATLLDEDMVDWLDAHRFGLTLSMDGPPEVHDLNRLTVGGRGTYDVVRRKVDMLLSRYRSRPVGCRVTLSAGVTDVEKIFDHLYHEVGFHEVGFGPVTSGELSAFNLPPDQLAEVFEGMKRLGRRYLQEALNGTKPGFANMHQLLTDLHEGNRKPLPCGAGIALLAVDGNGGLNLCHRFTGSSLPLFGDVEQGIDRPRLTRFLEDRQDRSNTGCATCRIRNICSGGCYHESYSRFGDTRHPVYHYCDLLRDWIDFGIEVYTRISTENEAFFSAHVSPRRGN